MEIEYAWSHGPDIVDQFLTADFKNCMDKKFNFISLDDAMYFDNNSRFPMVGKNSKGDETCKYHVANNLEYSMNSFCVFTFANGRPVAKALMHMMYRRHPKRNTLEVAYLCADSQDHSGFGKDMIAKVYEVADECMQSQEEQLPQRQPPAVALFSVNDDFYDKATPLSKLNKGDDKYGHVTHVGEIDDEYRQWRGNLRKPNRKHEVIDLTSPKKAKYGHSTLNSGDTVRFKYASDDSDGGSTDDDLEPSWGELLSGNRRRPAKVVDLTGEDDIVFSALDSDDDMGKSLAENNAAIQNAAKGSGFIIDMPTLMEERYAIDNDILKKGNTAESRLRSLELNNRINKLSGLFKIVPNGKAKRAYRRKKK